MTMYTCKQQSYCSCLHTEQGSDARSGESSNHVKDKRRLHSDNLVMHIGEVWYVKC